ncbi:MAG: DPP IV N-terminal domain-containing protein [Bacteroidota bacterium]
MKKILTLLFVVGVMGLQAQNEKINIEDYRRASFFLDSMRTLVKNVYVTPNWYVDSSGVWYTLQTETGQQHHKVDFQEMKVKKAFDHERVTQFLYEKFELELEEDDFSLPGLKFLSSNTIEFYKKDSIVQLDLTSFSYQVRLKEKDTSKPNESLSPDGKWIAFTKDYNLYIRSTKNNKEIQLSKTGARDYQYASWYGWGDIMEGENGDRPERFRVSWSPDSKKILTTICDTRSAEKMYLLDWSVDSLYRPRLLGYYRGSPGDKTMVYIEQVLFDVDKKKEIAVDMEPRVHIIAPYVRWMPDSKSLISRSYERGYQKVKHEIINAKDGSTKPIYVEGSRTSVNNAFAEYSLLEKDGKFLFTSEIKEGWNHLYLQDLESGLIQQLTQGEYMVNDVLRVDEENEKVYFTAMGKEPERNIYHQYLYSVDFEGKETKLLTPANAHHVIRFSPDGKYFVDNFSTATMPTVTTLHKTEDPFEKLELSLADATALFDTGWKAPERHIVLADDGSSEIYCAIWKPTNFDPNKKYPIIDYSYTGPFTFRHPRSFSTSLSGTNQSLADLGFLVIHIDGRGSAGRSKKFRDKSYKKLGYGLVDHVFAIKELSKQHSWIDADRVGIFGHSAGGYDAGRGMLLFPEFYKVAVASSGDHDHRMEKAWWPEMYMGWPVDTAYHNQSNITNAANLQGKLLLVHGGIDENVNPSATFKLSEALIKADKDFDLLIIPSQRHGYYGDYGRYFTKKRWNYFVEHLLGVEPIWDF